MAEVETIAYGRREIDTVFKHFITKPDVAVRGEFTETGVISKVSENRGKSAARACYDTNTDTGEHVIVELISLSCRDSKHP